MPVDLVMPRLSDTMTEGTVARWLKRPGEPVKRGEALAEIETDKATMPMEAFEDGTMGPVDVPEGQTVPLGSKIGVLYRPGEKSDGATPTAAPRGGGETKPAADTAPAAADAAPRGETTTKPATPTADTAPAANDAAAAPRPATAASAAAGEGSARATP